MQIPETIPRPMPRSARTYRPTLPIWVIVSAAWLGPALLAVFDAVMRAKLAGRPPESWRTLAWQGGDWLILGGLTPIVFRVARQFPIRGGVLPRNIALHVVASLALCAAWAGAGLGLRALLLSGDDATVTARDAVSWFLTTLPFGVAVYFAVLGVEHAAFYFLEVRARETQAVRLSAQLAEARLSALQMQLHPHFLFNSLNAIGVLVRDQDTTAASRMIELLGDLLREVLRTNPPPERSLATEIEFIERYLMIEQVRFSDRLRPIFDMDPQLADAAVPAFILQPLVENAVRHGVAKRIGAGVVRVVSRREGNDVVLAVHDDGPGPVSPPADVPPGVGLDNTRARLTTLYPGRGTLTLAADPAGGTVATVRLPYHVI
jgi:two-component system, LytTR family, sensor kinase